MTSSAEEIQSTMQAISQRIAEIPSIYRPLVLRLKQMTRYDVDDDGEILLEVVTKFLRREISAEALTQFWTSCDTQRTQTSETPKYQILADRLRQGELIPFIGPELHALCEVSPFSSLRLTHTLAERADYQNFNGPLSMISQYYQMTEYGRGTLLRTVLESVEPLCQNASVPRLYQLLGTIHQPLLILSASFENQLERVFRANQKPFVTISHLRGENDLGKVLIKYADRPQAEAPMLAEAVSTLRLMEKGYSIIYKVCGCFGLSLPEQPTSGVSADARLRRQRDDAQQQWDLLNEKLNKLKLEKIYRTDPSEQFRLEKEIQEIQVELEKVEQELDRLDAKLEQESPPTFSSGFSQKGELDSLLISEEDYFIFAKQVESVIPGYVARQVSQKSLLFLGHRLDEWQDRLILNAVLERKRSKSRSYAVQERPTRYESAYWKFHGVDVYQVQLKIFVEQLYNRIIQETRESREKESYNTV